MGWMELPVVVDALVEIALFVLTVAATVWFDVALVSWAIDAGRSRRWGWFGGLMIVTPCWLLATGVWIVTTTYWIVRNFGELWL